MLSKTVIDFFSEDGKGKCGYRNAQRMLCAAGGTLFNWGEVVPRAIALELELRTKGLLKYDETVYPELHKRDTPEMRKAMQDHCKAKRKNKAG